MPRSTTKKRKQRTPIHPPWRDMIIEAIIADGRKNGVSRQSIANFVYENYDMHENWAIQLRLALKREIENENLVKVRASYKLHPDVRRELRKKNKSSKKTSKSKSTSKKKKSRSRSSSPRRKASSKKKSTTKKKRSTSSKKKKKTSRSKKKPQVELTKPKKPKPRTTKTAKRAMRGVEKLTGKRGEKKAELVKSTTQADTLKEAAKFLKKNKSPRKKRTSKKK